MENAELRILLVEHDEDLLFVTYELLRIEGYDVRAVRTGRAALEVNTTFVPHLVILELELPDMSGVELGARLQRAHAHPCRLIALSCHEDRLLAEWHLRDGFSHFFVKPFEIPHMMHALEAVRLTQARA